MIYEPSGAAGNEKTKKLCDACAAVLLQARAPMSLENNYEKLKSTRKHNIFIFQQKKKKKKTQKKNLLLTQLIPKALHTTPVIFTVVCLAPLSTLYFDSSFQAPPKHPS